MPWKFGHSLSSDDQSCPLENENFLAVLKKNEPQDIYR